MSQSIARTALVTGAARGLGEAIAVALHSAGCRVALADLDGDDATAAAARLGPERAIGLAVDVRDKDSIQSVVDSVEEHFGPLEVLVNNAARSVVRPLWEIERNEWNDVMETNLLSALFAIQLVGPRMRERGFGRIINVASIGGQQGGLVMGAHYAASKAGMIVLTKIAAQAVASEGVTVNALAPAAIDGPMMRSLLSEDRMKEVAARIPVGRVGQPQEVGALAAFLASDEAGYITGATFDINGGQFMR